MPLRILHILDHSLPLHSGYAFRSSAIRREQEALGWETFWLTTPKQGPVPRSDEVHGGMTYYRTSAGTERSLLGQMQSTAHRLEKLIVELRPDIIQAHSPVLTVLPALWLRRRYQIPLVYERRSSWEDAAATRGTSTYGGWRYRASRQLETFAFRHVDAVTTICQGLADDIIERGINPAKITLVPNGVDPKSFEANRSVDNELARKLGLQKSTVLGYAGSFSPYEGLELLLEAAAKLSPTLPQLKVLLVGAGGNEDALRDLSMRLGLGNVVRFAGRVEHEQIQRYYSLVDIFVYPRQSTRLTNMVTPLKPLEAMAQGKVVLASDIGGHRELVQDQVTGNLFEAGSVDSLSDAIRTLIAGRQAWPEMTARARKFIEADRSWTRCVAAYKPLYERLVTPSAATAGAK